MRTHLYVRQPTFFPSEYRIKIIKQKGTFNKFTSGENTGVGIPTRVYRVHSRDQRISETNEDPFKSESKQTC